MVRYRRRPALIVLAVTALLGTGYVLAWDRVERLWTKSGGAEGVEALEKRIADGDKSAATWLAYAEALAGAKDHARAAGAYREVIRLDPGRREAKFQCALCLAHAGRGDELHGFLKEMILAEPKLVMEVMERPEAQRFLAEGRFADLKEEARNQAMD